MKIQGGGGVLFVILAIFYWEYCAVSPGDTMLEGCARCWAHFDKRGVIIRGLESIPRMFWRNQGHLVRKGED